jgi:dTMP kinase
VPDIAMNNRGKFIAIEGGEGVGKSTQIAALAGAIKQRGYEVITTREPGGTHGGEEIRQLLLSGDAKKWSPRAEALLFSAARSDHVEKLIRPALASGVWVISDRFIDSSRAYQGGGDDLSDSDIFELHRIGSRSLMPDRTLVLSLPEDIANARATSRDGASSDRIGARDRDYHTKVHDQFAHFAMADPTRVRLVDASGDAETVTHRLVSEIGDLL